jgi:NAD(P)-dependent dehydrogenase (short-subunit alcohol dehydrogenase family)
MNDVLDCYDGRPVVVTGCSSGIGKAVSTALAGAGARVIGVDRREPESKLCEFHATDLADRKSIASTSARLPGEIWALFTCAGISGGAAAPRTVVRVNFIGTRELLEAVADRIPRGGSIAITSSASGRFYRDHAGEVIGLVRTSSFDEAEAWAEQHQSYLEDRGAYRVSKEALILYSIDRCYSLGERGVRINCVAPGVTDTPMLLDSVKVSRNADYFKQMPQPLGRRAAPEEQANILLFLSSSWASYINGETVWSDGGESNALILPS